MKFGLTLGVWSDSDSDSGSESVVGQCAESVFEAAATGTVPEVPRDPQGNRQAFCKRAPKTGTLGKIICKGL
jgi:hypothetical protein